MNASRCIELSEGDLCYTEDRSDSVPILLKGSKDLCFQQAAKASLGSLFFCIEMSKVFQVSLFSCWPAMLKVQNFFNYESQ